MSGIRNRMLAWLPSYMPEPQILRNAPPTPPQKIEVARGLGLAYAVTPSSEVSAPRFPVRKLYHI
jgi:hypothetical protein